MQRRKVWFLLSIPAFILAVLLVVAEIANQLIVNVLVSGVHHPLFGIYELALTLMAVGALPFAAFLWLRHLPRRDADRFFDPFFRWLREGAAEEAERRELKRQKGARGGGLGAWLLAGGGVVALIGAVVIAASEHTTPATPLHAPYGRLSRAARRIGRCAPAPCAALAGGTLLVTSVSSRYVPHDLSAHARAFTDGGEAPNGFRWVKIDVLFKSSGAGAPNLRAVLRLDDGTALRPANALLYDPACRTVPAAQRARLGVPLCFIARGPHAGPEALVWRAEHLRLPL